MVEFGYWKAYFDLDINGQKILWDDLSDETKEWILKFIKDGYFEGDLIAETEEDK